MSKIKLLKNLVSSSEVAKVFFESLAARVKNYRITTVEQTMRLTGGGRKEVVDLFKQMEGLDLGTFIVGRRNGVSRFEWSVLMVDTAKAAFGELEEIEPLESSDLEELEAEEHSEDKSEQETRWTRHAFVLRQRSSPITLDLPEDLTEHEAQRLAKFMLSLPIGH